jgi:hypothetical protein
MLIRQLAVVATFAALLTALQVAAATSPTTRSPEDMLGRLSREALASPQAMNLLSELCTTAPQRLSGSPGAAAAVEWAEKTMRSIGLENVRLEPCMVPHWERGKPERLEILRAKGETPIPLRSCALGGSPPTPAGGVEAEVVMVMNFEELEQLGERARGKAVFFNRPMDPTQADPFAAYGGAVDQRSRGSMAAAKAGAVLAIVRSMSLSINDFPHTGSMRYEAGACVPTVAVSTLGAERLAEQLKRDPRTRVRMELDCRWLEDAPSFNVVGERLGRELPEEIVLVGGHLDAWDLSVGAHDDGAGCVQALEAARLWVSLDLRARRTLRVVLWMNEENGLRGASAYRDTHRDALDKHVFALESDRGGFAPRSFASNSSGASLETLRQLAAPLLPFGIAAINSTPNVGADVSALAQLGVPCAGFVPEATRYFDVHHCAADTLESVHPRELQLGALCVSYLCFAVADMPGQLERVGVASNPPSGH